jgi:hypothetical protein
VWVTVAIIEGSGFNTVTGAVAFSRGLPSTVWHPETLLILLGRAGNLAGVGVHES